MRQKWNIQYTLAHGPCGPKIDRHICYIYWHCSCFWNYKPFRLFRGMYIDCIVLGIFCTAIHFVFVMGLLLLLLKLLAISSVSWEVTMVHQPCSALLISALLFSALLCSSVLSCSVLFSSPVSSFFSLLSYFHQHSTLLYYTLLCFALPYSILK